MGQSKKARIERLKYFWGNRRQNEEYSVEDLMEFLKQGYINLKEFIETGKRFYLEEEHDVLEGLSEFEFPTDEEKQETKEATRMTLEAMTVSLVAEQADKELRKKALEQAGLAAEKMKLVRALRAKNRKINMDLGSSEKMINEKERMIKLLERGHLRSEKSYQPSFLETSSSPEELNRMMPQCTDTETAVVGYLLKNPRTELGGILPRQFVKMFYSRTNQMIYSVIEDLGRKADLLNVKEELYRRGHFQRIGGESTLEQCLKEAESIEPENFLNHVYRIEKMYILRMLAAKLSEFSDIILESFEAVSDINNLIKNLAVDIIQLLPFRDRARYKHSYEVEQAVEGLKETIERKGKPEISTCYSDLDKITYGIRPMFVMLGGRAKQGKTSFFLNLVNNVLKQGYSALIFSHEMKRHQILQRMLSMEADMNTSEFLMSTGLTSNQELSFEIATKALKDSPLVIYDGIPDKDYVRKRVELEKELHPNLKIVVIDSLQAHAGYRPHEGSKTDIYSEVIKAYQLLPNDFDVMTILTGQLNRKVEDRRKKRPNAMKDFSDCKGADEICDLGLAVYRPEFYWPGNEEFQGWMQVIALAERYGPGGRSCKLGFCKESGKITEWEENKKIIQYTSLT
ncbi:hypothetical protein JW851_02800 [Candidatus Woesearchaeota archaeon]|nr:hypothetical protein [Candidatus Woesearchaeota archaeon]